MRTIAIAKKVFKELLRDKRTFALMFIAPILIMWLLNIVFSADTTENVHIGAVDVPTKVEEVMKNVDNVSLEGITTKEEAEKKLKDGQLDTVIYYKDNKYEVTYANTDSVKTTQARQVLKASLTGAEIKGFIETIQKVNPNLALAKQKPEITESYNYGSGDTTFFNKIAPIVIGYISFFFVFLISGIALLKERTSGTLDRLLATPVKRSEIIFGYTISYGFLAIIQTIVITLSAIYLLKIEVAGSLVYVIIVNMLLALGALALGMLLSTAAKSEFQVMQFIPLVIIPQMFFSGIVPVENMGKVAVYISKVLPVTYSGDGLSKIILEGKNLLDIKGDIIALTIFFVVLITLNIIGLKRYRKV